MAYIDFLSQVHSKTKRDYLARVNSFPKQDAAVLAKKFDYDYWDGSRDTGYGGYKYDGRWRAVAERMVEHYQLTSASRILDIGCGKGFLLYDLTQIIPGVSVTGVDISAYALSNSHPDIKQHLHKATAAKLPFADKSFDFVFSLNVLHNLYCYDLFDALVEMERVGRQHKYLCVESYRNEAEKVNLLYWQLTCEMFCTPAEWEWWFQRAGYSGDYSFIFFE
ncbi:MAG: class I SAM-dependent methyltransferase [Proteobacteria bacterium]|nr:class I SAM-dependent methyltransferase [Pseudomonadota bacterium]